MFSRIIRSSIVAIILASTLCLLSGCVSPLLLASAKQDVQKVERLLAAGSDPNQIDYDRTALGLAIHNHNLKTTPWSQRGSSVPVILKLLDAGADINQPSINWGYPALGHGSPLTLAATRGADEVVALLLERGALIGPDDLNIAASGWANPALHPKANPAGTGLLLLARLEKQIGRRSIPAYLNRPDTTMNTVLSNAVRYNQPVGPGANANLELIRLLLENGADPNVRVPAPIALAPGVTALGFTSMVANKQQLQDPSDMWTPLHIAAEGVQLEVMELLLRHGADTGAVTTSGLTPASIISSRQTKATIAATGMRALAGSPASMAMNYVAGTDRLEKAALLLQQTASRQGTSAAMRPANACGNTACLQR